MNSVWADTAVTDDVLVQCVKDIRRSIGDDTHKPKFIKTVPRSGYRFIGDVEAVLTEHAGDRKIDTTEQPAGFLLHVTTRPILLVTLILVLVIGTLGWLGWRTVRASQPGIVPGKRSVAVMFFENRSEKADLDWLREGLADMLIADLSKTERLAVISREQMSAMLADRGLAAQSVGPDKALELARQFPAESLITGSFVVLGEGVRVDVQLRDASSGATIASESLTADRVERILSDIDLLSLKLARSLDAAPEREPGIADVMTDDLAAYRYYSLGVEMTRSLKNKEAIELFQKAIERDPQFAMAYGRTGYAYAVTWGRVDEGKPFLEKAYQLSDRLSEKDRLSIAAWYAIANQDFAMAIDQYREIVTRFAFETEAYWRLASLLRGEGRRDEAILVLRQGLAVDPQSKNLYNELGGNLSAQGKHADAISAHERYVALAPTDPNAYDSLGLSFQWAGMYEKAIENYQKAIELDPNFDLPLVHLANTQFRMGRYKAAIETFRRYIAEAPSDRERSRGYESIATVYLRKRDFRASSVAAKEAAKFSPKSMWLRYLIASERGDRAEAARLEKPFLENSHFTDRGRRPNGRFPLYYSALIAREHGRADEVLADCRSLLHQDVVAWHTMDFEDCLANQLLEMGRYDEAIAEYDRILKLAPRYPLASFHLAAAYHGLGRESEAVAAYQQFLSEWAGADDDIPEVAAARQFLAVR